jgi:hypothetical protein
MKSLGMLMAVVFAVAVLTGTLRAAEPEKKVEIKEVMKIAMKGGLWKKVSEGKATDDEKAQLVLLYNALHAAMPPKGDAASWKAKTEALLNAANDAKAGKAGALEALAKAANCMACHSAHRPPPAK